jgi:predicted RNase H-like nuclease (RuvC/YqgF family)
MTTITITVEEYQMLVKFKKDAEEETTSFPVVEQMMTQIQTLEHKLENMTKAFIKEQKEVKELMEIRKTMVKRYECIINERNTEITTLNTEIESSIKNVDSRCSVFDVKTNCSHILEIIDYADGIDGGGCEYETKEEQEKFDFACEQIAQAIDDAINMNFRGCHMTLQEHIFEESVDKARQMIDEGFIKAKPNSDEEDDSDDDE